MNHIHPFERELQEYALDKKREAEPVLIFDK